jgi:hypothetical protein
MADEPKAMLHKPKVFEEYFCFVLVASSPV